MYAGLVFNLVRPIAVLIYSLFRGPYQYSPSGDHQN